MTIIEAVIYVLVTYWLTVSGAIGTGGALAVLAFTVSTMGAVLWVIIRRSRR